MRLAAQKQQLAEVTAHQNLSPFDRSRSHPIRALDTSPAGDGLGFAGLTTKRNDGREAESPRLDGTAC